MAKFEVPREFSSQDDKYFKFFTKETVIVFGICAGISFVLVKIVSIFTTNLWPAIIVLGIITLIISGTTMIPISSDRYMTGGGNLLAILLMKKYIRKKEGRLYIKGEKQWLLDSEAEYLVRQQISKDHSVLKYKKRGGNEK